MLIGICDDERCYHDGIRLCAAQWSRNRGLESEPQCKGYETASALLYDWGRGIRFDILFLDILMDRINGLQLALEIRKIDPYVPIVFITNHAQYAADGYEAAAFRYLLKPLNERHVYECLDHAYSLMVPSQFPSVFVSKDGVRLRIDLKKIVAITCQPHHRADVSLADSQKSYSIRLKGSFDDLIETIPAPFLIRCHKSHVVNTMYIRGLTRTEIHLMNGETVPISRAYKDDVLTKLYTISFGGLL